MDERFIPRTDDTSYDNANLIRLEEVWSQEAIEVVYRFTEETEHYTGIWDLLQDAIGGKPLLWFTCNDLYSYRHYMIVSSVDPYDVMLHSENDLATPCSIIYAITKIIGMTYQQCKYIAVPDCIDQLYPTSVLCGYSKLDYDTAQKILACAREISIMYPSLTFFPFPNIVSEGYSVDRSKIDANDWKAIKNHMAPRSSSMILDIVFGMIAIWGKPSCGTLNINTITTWADMKAYLNTSQVQYQLLMCSMLLGGLSPSDSVLQFGS